MYSPFVSNCLLLQNQWIVSQSHQQHWSFFSFQLVMPSSHYDLVNKGDKLGWGLGIFLYFSSDNCWTRFSFTLQCTCTFLAFDSAVERLQDKYVIWYFMPSQPLWLHHGKPSRQSTGTIKFHSYLTLSETSCKETRKKKIQVYSRVF